MIDKPIYLQISNIITLTASDKIFFNRSVSEYNDNYYPLYNNCLKTELLKFVHRKEFSKSSGRWRCICQTLLYVN